MTNKENAQKVIRHIQESQGFNSFAIGSTWTLEDGYKGIFVGEGKQDNEAYLYNAKHKTVRKVYRNWIKETKVRNPELTDLFRAINDDYQIYMNGKTILYINALDGHKQCFYTQVYDYSKSLLANLEDNEELTLYLLQTFNIN